MYINTVSLIVCVMHGVSQISSKAVIVFTNSSK